MKISVIGTGYVGLVSACCFAEVGHYVIGADINEEKIAKLSAGENILFEEGLDELLKKNVNDSIFFTTDIKYAIENSDFVFIAVGTPSADDGSVDMKYVYECAKSIAPHISRPKTIITKSTVPVGTGKEITKIISETNPAAKFDVCSNPEFLREGSAVFDFMNPDRIVVGSANPDAAKKVAELYGKIAKKEHVLLTSLETAELIKYASNGFLATKIAFINEVADMCEKLGANVDEVAHGMGLDKRIGNQFLKAGPGYGGSCFPKDTKALKNIAQKAGGDFKIIDAVIKANDARKGILAERIKNNARANCTLAVLGAAFKAGTDDVRESPAIEIIENLLGFGFKIKLFDPEGLENAKVLLASNVNFKNIEFCADKYDTMNGADALVILTEWQEFKDLDLGKAAGILKGKKLFDFRNLFSEHVAKGFEYHGIGR